MLVRIVRALHRYGYYMTREEDRAFKYNAFCLLILIIVQITIAVLDSSVNSPIFKASIIAYAVSGHFWLRTLKKYRRE